MYTIKNQWRHLLIELYCFLIGIQYREHIVQRWKNDIGYKKKYGYKHILSNTNAISLKKNLLYFFEDNGKTITQTFHFVKKMILKRVILIFQLSKNIIIKRWQNFYKISCLKSQEIPTFSVNLNQKSIPVIGIKMKNKNYNPNNYCIHFKDWKIKQQKTIQANLTLFRNPFIDFKRKEYYKNPIGYFRDVKTSRRRIKFFKKAKIMKLFSVSTWLLNGRWIKKQGFLNIKHRAKQFLSIRHQIRRYYSNLSKRRFFNYFKSIKNIKVGDRIGNFVTKLEQRADIALVNYGIVPTAILANKLIDSGVVFENNKQITNPNYEIPIGNALYIKKAITTNTKLKAFSTIMAHLENTKMKMIKRRNNNIYRKKGPIEEHTEIFHNFFNRNTEVILEYINKLQTPKILKELFQRIIPTNNLIHNKIFRGKTNTYFNGNAFKICRYFFNKKRRYNLRTISYNSLFGKQEKTVLNTFNNKHVEDKLFVLKNIKNLVKYKKISYKKKINFTEMNTILGGIMFKNLTEKNIMLQREFPINIMTMSRIFLKRYSL